MKPLISPSIAALTLATALSLSASYSPAAYTQPASTFSAGGGVSTSAGFENLGIIDQPGIVGSSSSDSYTANHGFLSVLGDGFKILYPVIAVNKGSISFTLAANSTGNDTLDISNTGGSNLNWTIAKTMESSWLTTTPPSGSGAFSVNISADTTGLIVGNTYNDTLIISGAGIQQTELVNLSLTVTAPATYRLTVSIVSNNATKGGGDVNNGTGLISCSNTGNNPLTQTGTCQANLAPGASITLMQSPDSDSTVATWAGACIGTSNCVVANIATNTDITATFPYSSKAKILSNTDGYESFVAAYGAAATSDTINARAVPFTEGTAGSLVTLNSGKTINLVGGLNAYYLPTSGYTIIQNILKIGSGRLNIRGGVKIHP